MRHWGRSDIFPNEEVGQYLNGLITRAIFFRTGPLLPSFLDYRLFRSKQRHLSDQTFKLVKNNEKLFEKFIKSKLETRVLGDLFYDRTLGETDEDVLKIEY